MLTKNEWLLTMLNIVKNKNTGTTSVQQGNEMLKWIVQWLYDNIYYLLLCI